MKRLRVEDGQVLRLGEFLGLPNRLLYKSEVLWVLKQGFIEPYYRYRGSLEIQRIYLDKTACNYGGFRAWLKCSGCDKRCGVLYANDTKAGWLCRKCLNIKYKTQQDHSLIFKIDLMEAKRDKLSEIFIKKGVHHKTVCDVYRKVTDLDKEIAKYYSNLEVQLEKYVDKIRRKFKPRCKLKNNSISKNIKRR